VDSKDVNRELRRVVRPALREEGFTEFSDRNAWRYFDDWIWCVNFQSFSAYLAEGIGCTSFSFAVNLGLYLRRPTSASATVLDRPKELDCTFRFQAHKTLSQPVFHAYGRKEATDRPDVWFVAADGSNLSEAVEDARAVVTGPGLGQLSAYQNPLYAYCAVFDCIRTWPPRRIHELIDVWSVGSPHSPHWTEVVTLLAPLVGRDAVQDLAAGLPTTLWTRSSRHMYPGVTDRVLRFQRGHSCARASASDSVDD
jgi:hypothetical protein